MKKEATIGLDVKTPSKECNDKNCPFHGDLKIRGRMFTAKIIRGVVHRTSKIEFSRLFYMPKYERYEKRRTRIRVHVPDCIEVKEGDTVLIAETRPISKTKKFVVVEVK